MARMIQIRNVPDRIHLALKVRAAEEGVSLSDLLLQVAAQAAEKPSRTQLLERIRRRPIVAPAEPIAEATAAERSGR